jgi:hypothetical protein
LLTCSLGLYGSFSPFVDLLEGLDGFGDAFEIPVQRLDVGAPGQVEELEDALDRSLDHPLEIG